MFYTYVWLRENGTPYYVGKGKGRRAYQRQGHGSCPPPVGRTVFYIAKNEAEAFENEVALIWYYGRKDLNTGCLRNLTDGGENPPSAKGLKRTKETRKAMSVSMLESKPWGHGSTGYQRYQCRCSVCMAWHRKHYPLKEPHGVTADTRHKMRMSKLGTHPSEETRRKMSESHKLRGTHEDARVKRSARRRQGTALP